MNRREALTSLVLSPFLAGCSKLLPPLKKPDGFDREKPAKNVVRKRFQNGQIIDLLFDVGTIKCHSDVLLRVFGNKGPVWMRASEVYAGDSVLWIWKGKGICCRHPGVLLVWAKVTPPELETNEEGLRLALLKHGI